MSITWCCVSVTCRYDRNLAAATKQGVFKGATVGFSVGVIYFLIFIVYSVSFWQVKVYYVCILSLYIPYQTEKHICITITQPIGQQLASCFSC